MLKYLLISVRERGMSKLILPPNHCTHGQQLKSTFLADWNLKWMTIGIMLIIIIAFFSLKPFQSALPFILGLLEHVVCDEFRPIYLDIYCPRTRITIAVFIKCKHKFKSWFQLRFVYMFSFGLVYFLSGLYDLSILVWQFKIQESI